MHGDVDVFGDGVGDEDWRRVERIQGHICLNHVVSIHR